MMDSGNGAARATARAASPQYPKIKIVRTTTKGRNSVFLPAAKKVCNCISNSACGVSNSIHDSAGSIDDCVSHIGCKVAKVSIGEVAKRTADIIDSAAYAVKNVADYSAGSVNNIANRFHNILENRDAVHGVVEPLAAQLSEATEPAKHRLENTGWKFEQSVNKIACAIRTSNAIQTVGDICDTIQGSELPFHTAIVSRRQVGPRRSVRDVIVLKSKTDSAPHFLELGKWHFDVVRGRGIRIPYTLVGI